MTGVKFNVGLNGRAHPQTERLGRSRRRTVRHSQVTPLVRERCGLGQLADSERLAQCGRAFAVLPPVSAFGQALLQESLQEAPL